MVPKAGFENCGVVRRMTPSWQFMSWSQASLVLIIDGILIVSTVGCHSEQPEQVSASDRRIARESVAAIESRIASNQDVIRRHGRFLSIEVRSVHRRAAASGYALKSPAMLIVDCVGRFQKFSTEVSVQVFNGAVTSIVMEPSAEAETREDSPLSDCELVQFGDELWFVRPHGDRMKARSTLSCQFSHPDFEP